MPIFVISIVFLFGVISAANIAEAAEPLLDKILAGTATVEYKSQPVKGSHRVILSSPKRINNELVIEKDKRIEGELNTVLLRLTSESKISHTFQTFESFFKENGNQQFQCQQRACGVNSYWANDLLNERRLSGRDSDQYYISGTLQYAGSYYWLSAYLVSNALRQELVHVTYIETTPSKGVMEWSNGYLLSEISELPTSVLIGLKKELEKEPRFNLYLAAYVDGNKHQHVSEMESITNVAFIAAQKRIANSLSVETSRIKKQFVGAFHTQIPVDGSQVWFRLFLYMP